MKSFSEIETTSKRASRAVGFSWGVAEEVAKGIRLLELSGFSGIKSLNQYYKLLNKKIRDSNLPEDIRIGAIVRKDKVIIPRSNFIFEKDDLVVFLAKREQLKEVENIFSVSSI